MKKFSPATYNPSSYTLIRASLIFGKFKSISLFAWKSRSGLPIMTSAAEFSIIEVLHNGQPVEIRALQPKDRDDMLAAVGRTSPQSLYRRFFNVRRHFSEAETSFFLNVDFVRHVALVAVVEENGKPVIAGGVKWTPDLGPLVKV